jgi:hypothetical protein
VGVVVFAATAIAIAWMAMKINQTKNAGEKNKNRL